MSLLQSVCEPADLKRTKSGKGLHVDAGAALRRLKLGSATKRVKLAERNESWTKCLPFNSTVMEQYIDLDNCTYAVLKGGAFEEAINMKGVELFTNSAFALNSRYHEVDPFA